MDISPLGLQHVVADPFAITSSELRREGQLIALPGECLTFQCAQGQKSREIVLAADRAHLLDQAALLPLVGWASQLTSLSNT